MDTTVASKTLGEALAKSFHSLVADMRDAIYLAEVPESPAATLVNGKVSLSYPLENTVFLEVEPIGLGAVDLNNWGDVHRVKLIGIYDNRAVIV